MRSPLDRKGLKSCDEIGTSKYNFAVVKFFVIIPCWSRRKKYQVSFYLMCAIVFISKRRMKDLLLWTQIRKFHIVVWQPASTNCTKLRAASAARLFFLARAYFL